MRPVQNNKRMRGRNNNRKGPNPLSRSYESNGPDVKIRGTAHHVAEKYLQLARDAQTSGDPVMAESYLQHAEHYFRIIAAAQSAQLQAQQGINRPPGEADMDEGDDDDDFGGLPDRFASPMPVERFVPQQISAPQPNFAQPAPQQPQPYAERPYNGNGNGGADRSQNDRNFQGGGDRQNPERQNQERYDRNARGDRAFNDRQGGGNRDRNNTSRDFNSNNNNTSNNGNRDFGSNRDFAGRPPRNGGDRNGGDRGEGQRQDRGEQRSNGGTEVRSHENRSNENRSTENRSNEPRNSENRQNDQRHFEQRASGPSEQPDASRDAQVDQPRTASLPAVDDVPTGLPSFITAPVRIPSTPVDEVEHVEPNGVREETAVDTSAEDGGQFPLRQRRRRRPRPTFGEAGGEAAAGATESVPAPRDGGGHEPTDD